MTPESRKSTLRGKGDKQVPAEMCTHPTIEELLFLSTFLSTFVTIKKLLENAVFYVVRADML
jgi:hypothetical protein